MSLAAAQSAKRNLQCIRTWRMQARQNHLAPIIIFQIQVTRKAIYVHCFTLIYVHRNRNERNLNLSCPRSSTRNRFAFREGEEKEANLTSNFLVD